MKHGTLVDIFFGELEFSALPHVHLVKTDEPPNQSVKLLIFGSVNVPRPVLVKQLGGKIGDQSG